MRGKKVIGIVMSTIMLMSSLNLCYASSTKEVKTKDEVNFEEVHKNKVLGQVSSSISKLNVQEDSNEEVEFIVISQLDSDITAKLYKCGATYAKRFVEGVYKVKIPASKAYNLAKISQIAGVGLDETINIDEPKRQPIKYPQMEYAHKATSIKELWKMGFDGKGVTIGIVDTGIEPNHELLKSTSDGKLKIVDYQDFNYPGLFGTKPQEGDLKLERAKVKENSCVEVGAKEVKLPAKLKGKEVLVSVYKEDKISKEGAKFFDLNNDGSKTSYAVVAYDQDEDGNYESILFDTNNNNDLTDEKVMGIYKDVASELKDKTIYETDEKGKLKLHAGEIKVKKEYENQYNQLFNTIDNKYKGEDKNIKDTRLNFVCTRIDRETFGDWYLNISMDARGHGTHVAADTSANGYKAHEFINKDLEPEQVIKGAAPGANVMALKVFASTPGTNALKYTLAMQYAAIHGCDVVNLSLGGQPEFTDGANYGALYADLLTKKYGTLFVMANGNEGPGVNTNGSPGDSKYTLTVGAYCPSYYVVDKEFENLEDQMWYFSSVGPCDDGRLKPEIIAPGSMISAVPMWQIIGKGYLEEDTFKDWKEKPVIGYARYQGTSMASPYAAGCAAALKQVINEKAVDEKNNSKYHPLLLKEIIMKTADSTVNKGKYNLLEQGYGMIDPMAAYKEITENYAKSDKLPKLLTGEEPSRQWPPNDGDNRNKYTSDLDMYIQAVPMVKNDDKMEKLPFGIYIRDKEIPEEIETTLVNTTSRDANLNIKIETKRSSGSGEWIQVQDNVKVSKDKKESIKIKIDKSKLKDGINVALIELDDKDTYQMDCTIPVTIIKSPEISLDNTKVEKEIEVLPAAYERVFVKIPNELSKFKITLEVPEEGKPNSERIRPSIFFPNGLEYKWDGMNKFAGPQKDGKFVNKVETIIDREELNDKGNKNKASKWDGVWEIDAYCSLAAKNMGKAKITITPCGIMAGNEKIDLQLKPGNETTGKINILNTGDKDVKVEAASFVDLNGKTEKDTVEKLGSFESYEKGFEIKKGDKNIFQKAVLSNAKASKGNRVKLKLYSAKFEGGKYIRETQIASTPYVDISQSGMELVNSELKEGYYVVTAMPGSLGEGYVGFDITNQVVNESDGIKNSFTLNENETIKPGEKKTIEYKVKAPVKSGEYMAGIKILDLDNNLLKSIPVSLKVDVRNNIISCIQDKVNMKDEEVLLNIDADFEKSENEKDYTNKLYGIEFTLKYNPQEVCAEEIIKGDAFGDKNSYEVKKEIIKDEKGNETGEIKFAYAFKGMDFDGVDSGNIAKVRFKAKQFGKSSLGMHNMLVGNCDGNEISAKVSEQSLKIADPDVNGDGAVDVRDYAYVAYSYGADKKDVRYRAKADVNGDGIIDDTDVNYIIKYFHYNGKN